MYEQLEATYKWCLSGERDLWIYYISAFTGFRECKMQEKVPAL